MLSEHASDTRAIPNEVLPRDFASVQQALAEGARTCSDGLEHDAAIQFHAAVGTAQRESRPAPVAGPSGSPLPLLYDMPNRPPSPGPQPRPIPPELLPQPYYRIVDPSNWQASGDRHEIQKAYLTDGQGNKIEFDDSVCVRRDVSTTEGTIRTALALGTFNYIYHPEPETRILVGVEMAKTSTRLAVYFGGLPQYSVEALAIVQVELDVPQPYTLLEASNAPLGLVGAYAGIGLTIGAAPSPIPYRTVAHNFFQSALSSDGGAGQLFRPPPFMETATVISKGPVLVSACVQIDLMVFRLLDNAAPPTRGMAGIALLEPADEPRIIRPFSQCAGNGAARVKSVSCTLRPFPVMQQA